MSNDPSASGLVWSPGVGVRLGLPFTKPRLSVENELEEVEVISILLFCRKPSEAIDVHVMALRQDRFPARPHRII